MVKNIDIQYSSRSRLKQSIESYNDLFSGVEGYLVGLFSFGPGLGVLIGFFFDTTHYFIHRHNVSVFLVVCGALISTIVICAGTGLAALIPSNLPAMIIMIILRVLFGFLELRLCEIAVECCKFWFPHHFRMVQGITNGGYYLGAALFNQLSGVMYDFWENFTSPYMGFAIIVCFCLIFNALVLPNTSNSDMTLLEETDKEKGDPDYQYDQLSCDSVQVDVGEELDSDVSITQLSAEDERKGLNNNEKSKREMEIAENSLTPAIIIPMIGDICFDMMYGYAAALVVPYLNGMFQMPISQASFFLVLLNLSMMAGSSAAGALLQAKLISSPKIAALAAMIGFIGVWFLFPPVRIPGLFEQVPNVGYLAVCFVGFASMFGSVSSYKTMETIQAKVTRRALTVNVRFGFDHSKLVYYYFKMFA